MTTIRRALLGAAALPLLIVAQAQAQSAPVVTLVPAGWARWEISA